MPICEDLVVYEDRARRRSGGAERAEPRNAHAPPRLTESFSLWCRLGSSGTHNRRDNGLRVRTGSAAD